MNKKAYNKLREIRIQIRDLEAISSTVNWDVGPILGDGDKERLDLFLEKKIYQAKTSRERLRALSYFINPETGVFIDESLTQTQKSSIKYWWREWKQESALSQKWREKFTILHSKALDAQFKASKKNDFSIFAPCLEQMIDLMREKADRLGFEAHPYDALLDIYSPGWTSKKFEKLFHELERPCSNLVAFANDQKPICNMLPQGITLSPEGLDAVADQILGAMGFDRARHLWRYSASESGFSRLYPKDARMIICEDRKFFLNTFSAIIHEMGHMLYESNLPSRFYGTALCEAGPLAFHEGQAFFWERMVSHSKAYCCFLAPILSKHHKRLSGLSPETLYTSINIGPHTGVSKEIGNILIIPIVMDIEKKLVEGSLNVKDVPHFWTERADEVFGKDIRQEMPPLAFLGPHWAHSWFGYAPAYILGGIYAYMLFDAYSKKHPNYAKEIEVGDFSTARLWLKQNIHRYGARFSSEELMQKVTGSALDVEGYMKYLNSKYRNFYK